MLMVCTVAMVTNQSLALLTLELSSIERILPIVTFVMTAHADLLRSCVTSISHDIEN